VEVNSQETSDPSGYRREKGAKPACKPDSVRRLRRRDGHSSRLAIARELQPPTRGLSEQDHRPPTWCCSA